MSELHELRMELAATRDVADRQRNRAKLAEDTVQMLQAQLALLRAECEAWREEHVADQHKIFAKTPKEKAAWNKRSWEACVKISKARNATDAAGALRGEAQ